MELDKLSERLGLSGKDLIEYLEKKEAEITAREERAKERESERAREREREEREAKEREAERAREREREEREAKEREAERARDGAGKIQEDRGGRWKYPQQYARYTRTTETQGSKTAIL